MNKTTFKLTLGAAVLIPAIAAVAITVASDGGNLPVRPEGPCDIYAAGGTPCVAAHSSTRALYSS